MKTYLPYFCKKIGITLVIFAFILSIIANINDLSNGFMDGWNDSQSTITDAADFKIISINSGKTITWISLSFSFSGFLLYMFSKEKIEDEFIQKIRFMSLAKSLLITWIIASILLIINGEVKLEGFYILQFQLIIYVVIYNYYNKWKFK
jgi:hypothetical protein